MSRLCLRRLLGVTALLAMVNCAHQQPPESVAKPSGFVLVREYVDSFKSESGDQYQKVQFGWDYDQGAAIKRTFTMAGEPIATAVHPEITLRATDAELAYAFALVRAHPDLKAAAKRSDANLYGGFAFRNGEGQSPAERFCRAKTRCIHVIISAGVAGEIFLGHAIVDLASGKVIDSKFHERRI